MLLLTFYLDVYLLYSTCLHGLMLFNSFTLYWYTFLAVTWIILFPLLHKPQILCDVCNIIYLNPYIINK